MFHHFFKTPTNKKVLDLIKREVYPEFVRQVEMKEDTIEPKNELNPNPESDTIVSDTKCKKKQ